jgi:hypothetical protein
MRSSDSSKTRSPLIREATRFLIALAICATAFLSMGMQGGGGRVVGVTAAGGYLFRVFDDGSIEFMSLTQDVRNQQTAGWTSLPMDNARQSNAKPPLPL